MFVKLKTAVVIGTRPEIIKMSPIIRELDTRNTDYYIIHTGQHYSWNMDKVFFDQLKLTEPKYNLKVGSGSHAEQTAKMMIGIEKVFSKDQPDIVLVQGDTNSVLSAAITAAKLHIKVGHVEAGLRSYDRQMPEEINRVLTDHCSDYLFAPTEKARDILLHEGVLEDKIRVTGNTIVDAVYQNLEIAGRQSNILEDLNLKPKEFFLLTLHRQENIDDPSRFTRILDALDRISSVFHYPIIYPIHPRSRKMMDELKIKPPTLKLIEPVNFFGFLQLEKNARLILTDSGGVQEESCILGTRCVTLRDNTERPETVEVGANILAGTNPDEIVRCTETMLQKGESWTNPFGDGTAGKKIVMSFLR